MAAGDVIALRDFSLVGTLNGNTVNEVVHAELYETGAYRFGSNTGMMLRWASGRVDIIDTRYSTVNAANFSTYARAVISAVVASTITVTAI